MRMILMRTPERPSAYLTDQSDEEFRTAFGDFEDDVTFFSSHDLALEPRLELVLKVLLELDGICEPSASIVDLLEAMYLHGYEAGQVAEHR